MNIIRAIEAILFVTPKPLSSHEIAKALSLDEAQVDEAMTAVRETFRADRSGIVLLEESGVYRLATHPDYATVVDQFIKDEIAGELTKAQLETLTVIAYRGPITRPELEEIRGVNCAIIVRLLLMRGLIEEEEDVEKLMPTYRLSHEALRHLGILGVHELPEFETLHAHPHIEAVLQGNDQEG